MNNRSKDILIKSLRFFPPALIVLMLCFFIYFSWNYKLIVDDFQFQSVVAEKNIPDAAEYFYTGFNGRMASHIFLCSIFRIFQNKENLFFIYHFLMLGGFLFSLAHCLRKYLELFRNKLISVKDTIYYSAFITAFLFFFFFAGRVELWFWISATGVYLVSLIIALNAFALVLSKNQNAITTLTSLLLFFLVGGFSESFAIMYLIILIIFFLLAMRRNNFPKTHLISVSAGIVGLIAALLINIFSGGIHNRLGWLPQFEIQQSIKNTIHSLAFPILRVKHLPFVIVLIALFLLYSHFRFPKNINSPKLFLKQGLIVLLFISISFFIPSYLLSDIVPDRAASLGYLAGILFLFDYFIFRSDGFGRKQKELSL